MVWVVIINLFDCWLISCIVESLVHFLLVRQLLLRWQLLLLLCLLRFYTAKRSIVSNDWWVIKEIKGLFGVAWHAFVDVTVWPRALSHVQLQLCGMLNWKLVSKKPFFKLSQRAAISLPLFKRVFSNSNLRLWTLAWVLHCDNLLSTIEHKFTCVICISFNLIKFVSMSVFTHYGRLITCINNSSCGSSFITAAIWGLGPCIDHLNLLKLFQL